MADQEKAIQIRGSLLRIARLDAEDFLYITDPISFLETLRKRGEKFDLFTFQQPVADPEPKYNYPMEWEFEAVIPISTYDHWLKDMVPYAVRKHVKKAPRFGVELREVEFSDELAEGIWKIYNETPIRQGRHFRHFGKDLETVRREAGTYLEYSTFVCAYFQGELIGFLKLVRDDAGTQLSLMQIISLIEHRDKAPTNALLAYAVRMCEERGIAFFMYGQMYYGNKHDDSLSHFKKTNGFEAIRVPRYYVPCTVWGRIAFFLGLHHKLIDRLPARLANWMRDVRRKWYQRSEPNHAAAPQDRQIQAEKLD
jgi:hypothetical protein